MSELIESYIENLHFHNRVIRMRTEAITHAESLLQLPIPANCLNWQLGHLLVYREDILGVVTGEGGSDPAEFAIYGAGSPQMTDGANAIDVDTLKSRLLGLTEPLETALRSASAEHYAKMYNEERQMTVNGMVRFYLLFHEPYHIGQIEIFQELAHQSR